MMTDVVLVAGSYHPREGGAERQMRSLLPRLVARNLSVAVVTQVLPDRAAPRREARDGYVIYRVGSRAAFAYAPRFGQATFFVAAAVLSIILRPRTLTSLQMGSASLAAAAAARFWRAPHILRLTGGGTSQYRSEPLARAASRVGRVVARAFWRRQTTIVAPAQHLLQDFEIAFPGFPGRAVWIVNGVRLPRSHPSKERQVVWYGRAGSETSATILVGVANLMPDVTFSVIGKFSDVSKPGNVRVLGWQEHPEEVIGDHKVLLNTSASEGMPNTVLQAIAWGCRVVGFDNPGMREVANMYASAVALAPHGSLKEIVRLLQDALDATSPPLVEPVTSVEEVESSWSSLLTDGRAVVPAGTRRSPKRLLWWFIYAAFASRLPSWSKAAKRFRVFCARRFCADVHPTANINRAARLSWQTVIGPHGGVGEDCVLSGRVVVGPHVTMGPNCRFITGDHPVPPDYGSFRDMKPTHAGIILEEDAFLGASVTVLPGVTIGRGAAVGAGAVVAKDVAPGAIVVGNPARQIRQRLV
ncbi:glycosyltransferase [Microbacterium sp. RD1]|uniref:glycosyltransferase n=1 Tax=Microbacterium sp. RD1 TaxID=3457313 RepID=UPI003FA535FB